MSSVRRDWPAIVQDLDRIWPRIERLFPNQPPVKPRKDERARLRTGNQRIFKSYLWAIFADQPVRRARDQMGLASPSTLHRALCRWTWERKIENIWQSYWEEVSPRVFRAWREALVAANRGRRGVRGNQRRNAFWYVVPHLVMEELARTDRPRRSGTAAAGRGGKGKGAQPA